MKKTLRRKKLSLRQRIYLFVIVAGFMYILCPYVVHADVFGQQIPDLYVDITNNVLEVNDLLNKAFRIAKLSPYTLLKSLDGKGSFSMGQNVHDASVSAGLVIATLLLMVDFFRKSIHFEWSSRWENILVFLVKVIAVKQIVQNTDNIVCAMYSLCNYINTKAAGTDPQFLPCDDIKPYTFTYVKDQILNAAMPWWSVIKQILPGDDDETYKISMKAVRMFYPNAPEPSSCQWGDIASGFLGKTPNGKVVFNTTFEEVMISPYFLFMKLLAYYIFVIVVGRSFELCVYTLLAPLPMATFASEVTSDTAKNFIRNYMACGLQMTVILAFFAVYHAMVMYWIEDGGNQLLKSTTMSHILLLAALAVAISKSGEWSRRLTGAC
ncbi:MAG: hypothetical protein IKN85_13560 [Oscillospiraceae bacterium]|nr:hypothetical protein [Oscillospiraceae bacterium]